jgi:DNA polymerase III subunit delta
MAKLDARGLDGLFRNLAAWRLVLLHGDDEGAIRERSDRLRSLVAGADDPFRVVDVPREALARDPGLLLAEAATLPLGGGRRVVRLRDAQDGHVEAVSQLLGSAAEALVVLEAGELGGRSRLRALLEPAPGVAVVACWQERGDQVAATVQALLREQGVEADEAGTRWWASRLGHDRLNLRREVERAALYAGAGGRLESADFLELAQDGAEGDVDTAILAALGGDAAGADRGLTLALAAGATAVGVIRAALRQVQRLELVAAGVRPEELRPPVFFAARPAFDRAARNWTAAALAEAAETLRLAELRAKTGTAAAPVPELLVARAAIASLARRAASLSRR